MLSLLDAAHRHVVTWYVIFTDRDGVFWWNRWLRPGFQHVQAWREIRYGTRLDDVMWLRVDPYASMTTVDIVFEPEPPWRHNAKMTVAFVQVAAAVHKVRELFTIGPFSCVEHLKALLGIRSFWLRTPWQLYKHIRKHHGVLIS